MAEKVAEKAEKKSASGAKKASEKKVIKTEEFAVIETGGKQYKVAEGDILTVEKLSSQSPKSDRVKELKEGSKVVFDKVLLMDDGKNTKVGTPYITGAKVIATFEEEGKHKKIRIIKFKAKSRYFKKRGHRQPYSKVKITALK